MSTELENKLLKAKIEVMTKSVFISTISLGLRHVISADTPTADVDNITVRYNPDFIGKMPTSELAGLIAHECWHVAFQHIVRRGDRDPIIWNVAGDFVINYMLTQNNFEIPAGGCLDPKYAGMSTDAVYDALMLEHHQPNTGNMILDIQGGPGSEGGLSRDSDVTNIIVRARTQAQMAGTAAGEIPNEILRTIDGLLNPCIPWPVVLNKFLDRRTREEYSWARRNRRFSSVYMPSLHSYGLGHLTWAIDTSGSQTVEDLKGTLTEIRAVQRVFNPEHMTIIDCDARIPNIYEVDANTDILSLKFHGGGGTKFQPVLDYVAEHPTQALIYFTDLFGETNLTPVDYPVLWICNSEHAKSPFGETVYVK